MNIYFLVEGDTEEKVYKAWLKYLLPELTRIGLPHQVDHHNYYLFNAKGQPGIIYRHLPDAIANIQGYSKYNYLVICLDAEEVTIDYKKQEIYKCLKSQNIDLGNIQFHIIVQNRCFDTWCLGNKGIYPLQPEISPLLDYTNYYDVSVNCPEIMGKQNFNTHAQFHKDYLKELFKINNLKHYKITNEVIKEEYLEQLIARVQNETEHLPTFQTFIEFCNMIIELTHAH
ncbi:MAG: hypothetical protein HEQ20_25180 [Aphanizomenon flos-aquae KM1D3_PB]|uniref:hypothetical protein n=1 Tax=Aphanizomenon flos-aquae TaxID=1176 RepID=UPI000541ED8C|nr:hypothetical protein [Aphanizomenon flos-aquae]KHG42636.1 hypothetical protein OA07_03840 [Aphanizomenon flos-aquae 2012/KM1/D3]QSV73458.1 MAG: hypothetical protein HEQ20_25180 [Aphanizomenon flos-aquae KM1D3_PB]